jgi:hypothetical protein
MKILEQAELLDITSIFSRREIQGDCKKNEKLFAKLRTSILLPYRFTNEFYF